MKPLVIRTLPLSQLLPADYNPRTLSAKARQKLRASLETFGLVEPLVWNQRSGRLVGGHQRLQILHELGVADVPVSIVDLNEAHEKALNVVLNNLEAQGRYDPVKLAAILMELAPLPTLAATGFDAGMLRSLTLSPEPPALSAEAGDVEVTLRVSEGLYETISPGLDDLIRDYDLVSHVRRVPLSAAACSATTARAESLP